MPEKQEAFTEDEMKEMHNGARNNFEQVVLPFKYMIRNDAAGVAEKDENGRILFFKTDKDALEIGSCAIHIIIHNALSEMYEWFIENAPDENRLTGELIVELTLGDQTRSGKFTIAALSQSGSASDG